jgi:hypothetical protein
MTFERGGVKNKQTGVIKFGYIIMVVGRENVGFDMCHYIKKNKVIISLETSDKCNNI